MHSPYPQGPGWWQASDGAWYPPELHPQYRAFVPGAPGGPGGPGGPAPTPPRSSSGRTGWYVGIALGIVAVVVAGAVVVGLVAGDATRRALAGSATNDNAITNTPDERIKEDAPDPTTAVTIIGGPGGKQDRVIAAAIADIEQYWAAEMPKTYGVEYTPVTGGFYSYTEGEPLPPCAEAPEQVIWNAFYCGRGDDVAWDDTNLVPRMLETYGDLSLAVVLAHEFGHAVQSRARVSSEPVTSEQQADCFAGAWLNHVRDGASPYFTVDDKSLDLALAGFLVIADQPGTSSFDPRAHGSAFDRINSFSEGLDKGAAACAAYTDSSVAGRLVELPFSTANDAGSNGNAPYDSIIALAATDLEDYWSTEGSTAFNKRWERLKDPVAFDTNEPPKCGDTDTDKLSLFYCEPGRFVAYDNQRFFPKVYDAVGDFAVATLLASQYALAAEEQFKLGFRGDKERNLAADCLTGAWSASVFTRTRPSSNLTLSPGDFDEALTVLIALGASNENAKTHGTGFERVSAFRNGVTNGPTACSRK